MALYHQSSITNHSESILKSKIMSILMIIFVVVFFLSDLLRNILKCNCSPYSTLMTMYLPETCSTMRALGVLSSAFSLNASARQGACKRSIFKSIGVSPENQRWLPKQ